MCALILTSLAPNTEHVPTMNYNIQDLDGALSYLLFNVE
jgi:hypothetical protein